MSFMSRTQAAAVWTMHALFQAKGAMKVARAFDIWKAAALGNDPQALQNRLAELDGQHQCVGARVRCAAVCRMYDTHVNVWCMRASPPRCPAQVHGGAP